MGEQRDPLLEAYRASAGFSDDAHDRVLQRIKSSIAAGEPGPRLRGDSPRASRSAPWLAAALVVVAAGIGLAWLGQWVLSRSQSTAAQEAPYVSEPATPTAARSRQPVISGTRAVPGPGSTETENEEPALAEPRQESSSPVDRDRPRNLDPPQSRSTLTAELKLMEAAKQALEQKNARGALALLDRHEASYPTGQLREDRMALRVLTLCALGKTSQARGEARVFARQFPGSLHLEEVSAACREAGK